MKKSLTLLLSTCFLFLFVTTCDRSDNPPPEDIQEFGYLSLQVGLKIEASSVGRTEAVDPSDFLVTIHDASDGSEVMRWDTYAEVPAEVQLPTGSYFVRATNLEFPADAAFEQPWYFGESEVFTIDKEEIKTIDVTCTLANCKISFVYSQHVLDNFTNWNATATIDDGSGNGDSLEWFQSDPAEGYFITDFPIDIAVHLEYEKAFSNELITRDFNTTISTPLPATHYRININASLEDGKIVINLTVDDSFETVDIDLGDEVVLDGLLPGSQIITEEADEQKLIGWIDPSFYFQANLLFTKELGDGQRAVDFHTACDNIPNTLVIIKTTAGYIFGGYNEGVWSSSVNSYVGGLLNNFLFSINNDAKWTHKRNSSEYPYYELHSILSHESYGPVFGGGSDINIGDQQLETGYTIVFTYNLEGTISANGLHEGFAGPEGLVYLGWTIETMEVWELKTSGNSL